MTFPLRLGSAGRLGVRLWRGASLAAALLLAARPASAGNLLDWLFRHDVQVITSTDMMPAGTLLRPPSPSSPVYYFAANAGYHDFGGIIAGDRLPATGDMIKFLARALAKGGFLPADAKHPPTECIVFTWGTFYRDIMPSMNPDWPGTQMNRLAMVRFLGGDKLGLVPDYPDPWGATEMPGLTRFNPDAEAIADVARDDLYVVALAGYEFPVKEPKHPKLLWRTKISCPARGLVMSDTLPTMVAIAAPYIGRETGAPVWINASDKFKPEVHIGNPKFEGYLDSTPMPVYEARKDGAK
ncbi:MAG TPA: hypothetical protein VMF63_09680 [Opitutaceae bacterium]|nr:hypothetical protein [Opitutaceae bacterium]